MISSQALAWELFILKNNQFSYFERVGQILLVVIVLWVAAVVLARLPLPVWNTDSQVEAAMTLSMKMESTLKTTPSQAISASWIEQHHPLPRAWRRAGNGWSIASEQEQLEVGTWRDSSDWGFALVYNGLKPEDCQDLVTQLWDAFDQTAINADVDVKKEGECNLPLNQVRFYRTL